MSVLLTVYEKAMPGELGWREKLETDTRLSAG